jgi:subtilisin family serine protease
MNKFLPLFLCLAFTVSAHAQKGNSDGSKSNRPTVDNTSVLVVFNGEPLSTYVKTKPPQGKKIDFNNNTTKSYRAQLSALRNDFKQWLQSNAPKAKVTGEFDISLNAVAVQLNGEAKTTIEKAPQVSRVDYEGVYYPLTTDPDLALIHAIQAWSANGGGGAANAGAEVKVAIVDTGIDIRHPCFSDTGYASKTQLGDRRFTNNKVIAAKMFNNKGANLGLTAEAIQEHGSHVAGTVACNYNTPAVVDGVTIPYGVSGVAPRALLGNYNVFPGPVENARSEDILNALEAAYADGFDVANMSLGGGSHGNQDLLTIAADDLDQANMVVAVAAGNSGPGNFTVESPGSAARALSAGASTVPHYIATPVTVNGQKFGALAGEFATVGNNLSAPLGVVLEGTSLGFACSSLPAGSLNGKIALISRGGCSFSVKVRNAQTAGAVAVLMVNNRPGDPIQMAQDGTPNQPTIPAYMLGQADGQSLVGSNGSTATIGAVQEYFLTANADIMADFSSQGPTDVDFRVKPDVVAPGVNVLSSIPVSFCGGAPCWAFFQGTSMATPHLAGSAAVVRQQHSNWSAAQIRSAIVNTADQGVLKNYLTGALETDVNITGSGRENLLSAVNAKVAVDPVSVSFGAVPSGSGQTQTFTATLTNIGSGSGNYSVSVGSGGGGVTYSVSPSSVSIAPGASANVTITMSAKKGATGGGHQALLSIKSGGNEVAHAVVYSLTK